MRFKSHTDFYHFNISHLQYKIGEFILFIIIRHKIVKKGILQFEVFVFKLYTSFKMWWVFIAADIL